MKKLVLILIASALLLLTVAISPTPAAEMGGPVIVELDRLDGPYGPVNFSHKRHATRFADGCGDCHHQHRDFDRLPCKRCHAIDATQFKESVTRSFRPCSSCHGDPDPATPDVPSLKVAYHEVCFGCHKSVGDLGASPKSCDQQCHARK